VVCVHTRTRGLARRARTGVTSKTRPQANTDRSAKSHYCASCKRAQRERNMSCVQGTHLSNGSASHHQHHQPRWAHQNAHAPLMLTPTCKISCSHPPARSHAAWVPGGA
jgi:hypothetical protein